jgi:uncharacterized protein (UPF0210 family)
MRKYARVWLGLLLIPLTLVAASLLPAQAVSGKVAKVRTVTTGIALDGPAFDRPVSAALEFLQKAKQAVVEAGYEVQTLRLTTTPCEQYLKNMSPVDIAKWARSLDRTLTDGKAVAALGPANSLTVESIIALLSQTENVSATIAVTTADNQLDEAAVRKAAAIMHSLSLQTKEGLGNFRFAAIANCPAGIPFFPAGYHKGATSDFAVGMEGAAWVLNSFSGAKDADVAKARLKQVIVNDLSPLSRTMAVLEKSFGRVFSGFDVSTAPQAEVSIGKAVEQLTGRPFGGPGTLAACAVITDALKTLPVKTCGYSGLMLPVMDTPRWPGARRKDN